MTDAASWSLLATPFSSSPWIGMDRVYVYTDCNNRITSLSLWIWEESLSSLSSLSSWSLLSTDNIQRSSKPVGSFFRTTLIITVAPETVPCTRRCRLSLSSARQHCSLCEWWRTQWYSEPNLDRSGICKSFEITSICALFQATGLCSVLITIGMSTLQGKRRKKFFSHSSVALHFFSSSSYNLPFPENDPLLRVEQHTHFHVLCFFLPHRFSCSLLHTFRKWSRQAGHWKLLWAYQQPSSSWLIWNRYLLLIPFVRGGCYVHWWSAPKHATWNLNVG